MHLVRAGGSSAARGQMGGRMCRVVYEQEWVESEQREGTCGWCGAPELLGARVEVDHDCGADAAEELSISLFCATTIRSEGLPLVYRH